MFEIDLPVPVDARTTETGATRHLRDVEDIAHDPVSVRVVAGQQPSPITNSYYFQLQQATDDNLSRLDC